MTSIEHLLPQSLLLPSHLSATRYLVVCTLTIAAWDTLVLSARTWQLMRTPGWAPLKILMLMMRYLMPIEFIAVGVALFSPDFSRSSCDHFYLFEPITTAILTSLASSAMVICISAIYDRKPSVVIPMVGLLVSQVAIQFACCFFYRSVPLAPTQGCIAGPKHNWVGIYWAIPTILYGAAFVFATMRSMEAQRNKAVGLWKLMLRDGLNLYGAVLIVNLINVLFWFIVKPSDDADPIRTITTSMTTVLTTTMTLRIILLIRGSLVNGGSFGSSSSGTSSGSRSNNSGPSGPVRSNTLNNSNKPRNNSNATRSAGAPGVYDPSRSAAAPTFSIGANAMTRSTRPGFEFEDAETDRESELKQGSGVGVPGDEKADVEVFNHEQPYVRPLPPVVGRTTAP